MTGRRGSRSAGFTLIELLVGALVFSGLAAALFVLLGAVQEGVETQTEMADVQQRLRVAASVLGSALRDAGAGAMVGDARGPLARLFPPVLPYRVGPGDNGPSDGAPFLDDLISLISVPFSGAQAQLAAPVGPGSTTLTIALAPGCPPVTATSTCGFGPGTLVLLADDRGRRDLLTVTAVAGTALTVSHTGPLAASYPAGSLVSEVTVDRYYREAGADGGQLVHDGGSPPGFPVVDHLVGLTFEYLGDPRPPQLVLDPPGAPPGPPRTTYGPAPPPTGTDDPADTWPDGENCLFTVAAGAQGPRLAALSADPSLVPITAPMLDDGPWCPDGASPVRYDADALRIRRVRVRLRVEASSGGFRGPAGPLFARAGTARRAARLVPDQAITLDVTPPNLLGLR